MDSIFQLTRETEANISSSAGDIKHFKWIVVDTTQYIKYNAPSEQAFKCLLFPFALEKMEHFDDVVHIVFEFTINDLTWILIGFGKMHWFLRCKSIKAYFFKKSIIINLLFVQMNGNSLSV